MIEKRDILEVDMMQKEDKRRQKKMSKKQQEEHEKSLELPINKFMNAQDDEGNLKYPVAVKLRKYYIDNPDAVLNSMRLSNALLHELRWRLQQAKLFLKEHMSSDPVKLRDKNGNLMDRDDCYLSYISHTQNVHIALSKLREHLSIDLLAKCDGSVFTLDQYNDYVLKVEAIVKELGHELFPEKIELIQPL